jgi:hypothetical protein
MALLEENSAIAVNSAASILLRATAEQTKKSPQKKAMLVLLYSLGKASFTMLGRLFDMWPSQVYRWIVREGLTMPEQKIDCAIKEMEFDEMWHFIQEKNKLWVIKAVNRGTGRTVA